MKPKQIKMKIVVNSVKKATNRIKKLTRAIEKLTVAMDNYNEVFLEHKDLISEIDLVNKEDED